MSLAFTLLIDAAVALAAAALAGFLLLLSRGAGWAWEHRPDRRPSRLDRVLAQCERDREDAMLAVLTDKALWAEMERMAEQ